MKNFSTTLTLFVLVFALSWTTQTNAQPSSLAPCSTVVGSSCVGACSPVGIINYNVGPLCPSLVVPLCVETTNSSLCPSHAAIAKVFVNGVLVASGDITATGSSISFSAPCGANVKVVAKTKLVNPIISCVWLGEVDFVLKR